MNDEPNDVSTTTIACGSARRLIHLLCFCSTAALLGCSTAVGSKPTESTGFVHVDQGGVVNGVGRELWLRGVNFGDWNWDFAEIPRDHDELDYARLSAMGMNVARLVLSERFLETDPPSDQLREDGVAWIDQNIEWARAHGVYLILNSWIVPGGLTSVDCANDAFWDEPEYQDRYVALWQALAKRYASEKTIAGYALFDGPNPSRSLEQWRALAARTTNAIREVDQNHMLVAQRTISIGCVFDQLAEESFVRLDDDNVLYEFDRLQPWNYVAQLLDWSGLPEYGAYPDTGLEKWLHGSWDSRPGRADLRLKPDETEWTERHFYYTVTDPKFLKANPCFQSDNNSGTVYFDDVVINELDENGVLVGTIKDIDLEDLSSPSWYLWQGNAEGVEVEGPGIAGKAPDGHRGTAAITITGTGPHASLTNSTFAFPVVLGHTYEVTSWIKGKNSDPNSESMVRLDFWGHGDGNEGFAQFDKKTLEDLFDDFLAWGSARGVPMNVSSFGTGRPTFEDERGGLTWANDMIDIMIERNLHFQYYTYRDEEWGIYANAVGLPDPATVNQRLVDLFTWKLK